MPPPTQPLTLWQRVSKLALSLQFLWFIGHVTTVLQTLLYVFYSRLSTSGAKSYSKAYYGTLLSYGIILYKAHGVPQISRAYLQRILMDENTQYLLLALIWLTSRPIWVTLIPFGTFSLFHSLTYLRQEILPTIFPPTQSGTTPTPTFSLARTVSAKIGTFVSTYQTKALYFVAYVEVWLILPYVTFSIFFGRASFFTPLLYSHFLRFRYFFSPMTKEAFGDVRTRLDGWIEHNPSVPQVVKTYYVKARQMIISYGDVEGMEAAAAAAAGGDGGAR